MGRELIAVADRAPSTDEEASEYVLERRAPAKAVDHPESMPRDEEATVVDALRPIAQAGLKATISACSTEPHFRRSLKPTLPR